MRHGRQTVVGSNGCGRGGCSPNKTLLIAITTQHTYNAVYTVYTHTAFEMKETYRLSRRMSYFLAYLIFHIGANPQSFSSAARRQDVQVDMLRLCAHLQKYE